MLSCLLNLVAWQPLPLLQAPSAGRERRGARPRRGRGGAERCRGRAGAGGVVRAAGPSLPAARGGQPAVQCSPHGHGSCRLLFPERARSLSARHPSRRLVRHESHEEWSRRSCCWHPQGRCQGEGESAGEQCRGGRRHGGDEAAARSGAGGGSGLEEGQREPACATKTSLLSIGHPAPVPCASQGSAPRSCSVQRSCRVLVTETQGWMVRGADGAVRFISGSGAAARRAARP